MDRIIAAPMVAVSTANARRLMRIIHAEPVLYTEMLMDKVLRIICLFFDCFRCIQRKSRVFFGKAGF